MRTTITEQGEKQMSVGLLARSNSQHRIAENSKYKVKKTMAVANYRKKNRAAIKKQLGIRTEQRYTICDNRIVSIEEGSAIS